MITVGYGDIVPVNNNEKIYSIFAMLVACGVFAYTMNSNFFWLNSKLWELFWIQLILIQKNKIKKFKWLQLI